jgi:hypothetical protein
MINAGFLNAKTRIDVNRDMKDFCQQLLAAILTICALSGCATNDSGKEKIASTNNSSSTETAALPSEASMKICPVPPPDYQKLPGYQPSSVDPSLEQKPLAFVSPTFEGDSVSYHLSVLEQPVKFCGTAKNNIVRVELFSTGAYLYEKKYPVPTNPELPLGKATIENGIWFLDYDFKDGEGRRAVIAKGFDANNKVVFTTPQILITLAGINPG